MINDDDKTIKKVSTDNYAVALTYNNKNDPAPKVAAKGAGHIAQKIIELAIDNGIEIKEDKDLIEVLKAVDIDDAIPIEAFGAVAEVLSYIYKQNATNN